MKFGRVPCRFILLTVSLLLLQFSLAVSAPLRDLSHKNAKKRIRATEKVGQLKNPKHIPLIRPLLKDPVVEIRAKAVAAITSIGTQHSLSPLRLATNDSISEIQIMATDGLVNFYYPGYVSKGFGASLKKFGAGIKNRLAQPAEVIVDPYLKVSPDVIAALSQLISSGVTLESRANAARAVGILRGDQALPQLLEALRSKNTSLIVESVQAIEKIGDVSTGPSLVFLLRDLDERVQLSVVKAVGQLLVRGSIPELVGLVKGSDNRKIRRQALIALAKIPNSDQRTTFLIYLRDKDHQIRAAATEGIGRSAEPTDLAVVTEAFEREKNESARLSTAFAAVYLGDLSYINYLVDALSSTFHRMEARPFLVELSRKPAVLEKLYRPLISGTNDQRRHLAYVLSRSGTKKSISYLDKLTHDSEPRVARAAIEAIKTLQARF